MSLSQQGNSFTPEVSLNKQTKADDNSFTVTPVQTNSPCRDY